MEDNAPQALSKKELEQIRGLCLYTQLDVETILDVMKEIEIIYELYKKPSLDQRKYIDLLGEQLTMRARAMKTHVEKLKEIVDKIPDNR